MCSAAAPTRMSEGLIGRLVRGPPPVTETKEFEAHIGESFRQDAGTSFFFQCCIALRGRTFGWLLYSVLSFSQALSLACFELLFVFLFSRTRACLVTSAWRSAFSSAV
ncbi:unnamed protein product [Ixodes persulcatus]